MSQDRQTSWDQYNFRMRIDHESNLICNIVIARIQRELLWFRMLQQEITCSLHVNDMHLIDICRNTLFALWILAWVKFDDLYSQCHIVTLSIDPVSKVFKILFGVECVVHEVKLLHGLLKSLSDFLILRNCHFVGQLCVLIFVRIVVFLPRCVYRNGLCIYDLFSLFCLLCQCFECRHGCEWLLGLVNACFG